MLNYLHIYYDIYVNYTHLYMLHIISSASDTKDRLPNRVIMVLCYYGTSIHIWILGESPRLPTPSRISVTIRDIKK